MAILFVVVLLLLSFTAYILFPVVSIVITSPFASALSKVISTYCAPLSVYVILPFTIMFGAVPLLLYTDAEPPVIVAYSFKDSSFCFATLAFAPVFTEREKIVIVSPFSLPPLLSVLPLSVFELLLAVTVVVLVWIVLLPALLLLVADVAMQ